MVDFNNIGGVGGNHGIPGDGSKLIKLTPLPNIKPDANTHISGFAARGAVIASLKQVGSPSTVHPNFLNNLGHALKEQDIGSLFLPKGASASDRDLLNHAFYDLPFSDN